MDLIQKSASKAGISASEYIRSRIGTASVALSAEVNALIESVRNGKESDPYKALSTLAARLEYHVRAWVELWAAAETFRPAEIPVDADKAALVASVKAALRPKVRA